jgi:tetratricopeptide (TPR) repeat protein
MTQDISHILAQWPYDPQKNVRLIDGADGRQKLQVRLPIGIEQFEVDGRPDGERPYGRESALEEYLARRDAFREEHGSDEGFRLDPHACSELREESLLYYYRYVLFFQLGDYDRTLRDVERNRALFDFVGKYATDPDDVAALEQYRPYIIRMSRTASALKCADQGDFDRALAFTELGLREINDLADIDNDTFRFEKKRSIGVLRGVRQEILSRRPISEAERLRRQINQAVAEENYERAAQLRDQLRDLELRRRHREDG